MLSYLENCLERGRYAWASGLAALSVFFFILLVGANIGGINPRFDSLFSLRQYLSTPELVIVFIISPLFFTRYAGFFSLILTVYLIERFYFGDFEKTHLGPQLLIAASTLLIAISDQMPWNLMPMRRDSQKFKEFLLQILVLFSLISILYSFVHLKHFQVYLWKEHGLAFGRAELFFGLAFMAALWLLSSLDILRCSALLLLILPSAVVSSYVLEQPLHMLLVPFVLGMALSLTQIRRSYLIQA